MGHPPQKGLSIYVSSVFGVCYAACGSGTRLQSCRVLPMRIKSRENPVRWWSARLRVPARSMEGCLGRPPSLVVGAVNR